MKIQHLAPALLGAVVFATACTSDLSELAGPEEIAQPQFSATASTTQTTINLDVVISAANYQNCFGEDIHFMGPIHIVFHETVDAAGKTHWNGSGNFQGVKGYGLTSGLTYRLVGRSGRGFNGPWHRGGNGAEDVGVWIITQNWIAQGDTGNLTFKTRFRAIVNANGELTTFYFEETDPCAA
jgi:hypothetical protein